MKFSHIRLLTAFFSLLLSVSAYYFDDIINSDGIMYMEMVSAYRDGGLAAMATIYDWGFFTLLVAWLSQLFSTPPELTANGLNSVLFVVFTDSLLMISRLLLPNLRQVGIAAVLILSFFTLNDYRDFVIRDIGYWAFVTLALYHFIRYQDQSRWRYALSWQLAMIIAVLFRVEGLVLLALLPLYQFARLPFKPAAQSWLRLNTLVIPLFVITAVSLIGQQGWGQAFSKFSDYLVYLNTETLSHRAEQRLDILEDKILTPFSAEYSGLILYSGLLVMLAFKLIEGLSVGYVLLLAIAGWQNRQIIAMPYRGLVFWFFSLNVLILITFLFRQYFVVGRYCMMAVIGLFLLVLPYLTRLIEQHWLARRRGWVALLGFIVLAGLIDSFHTTNSKTYIKQTAIWAAKHLDARDRILSDDEFLKYYFVREQTSASLTYRPQGLGNYKKFDYLLVVEKRRQPYEKQVEAGQLELVYQSRNRRGNQASVYRVLQP